MNKYKYYYVVKKYLTNGEWEDVYTSKIEYKAERELNKLKAQNPRYTYRKHKRKELNLDRYKMCGNCRSFTLCSNSGGVKKYNYNMCIKWELAEKELKNDC